MKTSILLKFSTYLICIALILYQCVGMYANGIKPLFEMGFGLDIYKGLWSHESEDYTILVKLFAILRILTTVIFLASIYFLMKITSQMFNSQYFEKNVDKEFIMAGKLIFISGLLFAFFSISLNIIAYFSFKDILDAPFNPIFIKIFPIESLPTSIITSFLGLLFTHIGNAFNSAYRLKTESDLTI